MTSSNLDLGRAATWPAQVMSRWGRDEKCDDLYGKVESDVTYGREKGAYSCEKDIFEKDVKLEGNFCKKKN